MIIKEIMTKKVEAVAPETTLYEVARKFKEFEIGTLPVEEKGKVIGLITDRDLVTRGIADGWDFKQKHARDIMTKDIVFCYDDQELSDVAHLFEEKKLYRLPVMDHGGKMVGMFSVSDLAQHASYELTGEVMHAVSRHTH